MASDQKYIATPGFKITLFIYIYIEVRSQVTAISIHFFIFFLGFVKRRVCFARNTLKLLYIDSPESGDELRKKIIEKF